MSTDNTTVLVCGDFCSGKSSLINALLGVELLISDVLPITNSMIELVYGKKTRVQAFYKGIKSTTIIEHPTQEDFRNLYCIGSRNENFSSLPQRVVIECNNSFLKQGIHFIEIRSAEELEDNIVNYLYKTDVILYTMSSTIPFSKYDRRILTDINNLGFHNIVFAYTKMSCALSSFRCKPMAEFTKYKDVCTKFVLPYTSFGNNGIYFVDSFDALEAKKTGDCRQLITPGIEELERCLLEIQNEKRKIHMEYKMNKTISIAFETLEQITSTFGKTVAVPIYMQLKSAKNRFEDEYLNLAVIGDFSCGKSTFLNALFGRDILSTDMQPTTAVPTYIRWNNSDNNFAVVAYDISGGAYELSTHYGKGRFEKLICKSLPDNADKLIDAVTTDNSLCKYISKIELKAPKNKRFPNICLIDTPGVNPGSTGTENHVRVTQNVLRNASDAAIIMFPAEKVFTDSFKKFLEENANHLLNQSIFVITKGDMIKNNQTKTDLLDFVRGQLQKMGILNPHIYCVSAGCALDVYTETDTSEKCKTFCTEFEDTVNSIFSDLTKRRNAIVYDNVHTVIEKVSKVLSDKIIDITESLEASRNNMLLFSPENMQKECDMILNQFIVDIDKVKNKYLNNSDDIVSGAIGTCRIIAYTAINQKTTKSAVSDYVNQYGAKDLQPVIATMKGYLSSLSAELKEKYGKYSNNLESCFRKYQVNIAGTSMLTTQIENVDNISSDDVSVSVSGHITGSDILEEIGDAVDDIFDSDDLVELLGNLAVGFLLVSAGMVIGVINAFKSLESIKEDARNDISATLESNRATLCEKLKSSIGMCQEKYKDSAKKLPGQLKSKYYDEYSKAMNRYNEAWADIEKQIAVQKENLNLLHVLKKELEF